MAIQFRVIKKSEPGIKGGGKKRFYASGNITGEKTLAGLTRDIEKMTSMSGSSIRTVLYAMLDAVQASLAEGKAVRFGDIGSLRINISSEGKNRKKEVTEKSIKAAKVIFTSGMDLKKMLLLLEYKKT